jgi:dihydroorotate dehydrogenase (NAD+) catalytic subunit
MVDLSVKIGSLKLKNPIMVASGTFGPEYKELADVKKLGAIVLKTVTLEERKGNPAPRVAETASGMLNSIGLENKGIEDFIKNKLPKFKNIKAPLIASIAGNDEKEYGALAKRLGKVNVIAALEINLSCPNVKHGTHEGLMAQDAGAAYAVVRAVRKATRLPLIAKLSPNVADITKIAIAAERAGADAVLIANTVAAMSVDIETQAPKLGNITGGLSGPAIKPIALKLVWNAYNKIEIPIVGCGGIMDYKDALEFMLCGARAIQVGTATFVNPNIAIEIIDDIKKYCIRKNINKMDELIGNLKTGPL